jgi:hypothetical protein
MKLIRQKIAEDLNALRFRIVIQEQIIDLSRQELYRKLANPLYDNSIENIISWELKKQIIDLPRQDFYRKISNK